MRTRRRVLTEVPRFEITALDLRETPEAQRESTFAEVREEMSSLG
ncbi:hypothetical protein [Amycolatopsis mediterranei]|uniref:Uncharacterized protein n=1 Tax=Amycolatopsis mediterranei (strain S699) TaxID=713604 RepID=A0A9R0P365_AMYMS|nr:hypothetical protein [Amycolatopsis mediterranei]AEK45488.1 hypothetical protein RAM_35075 [Amycolatopsis mediterranei S699]